MGYNPFLIHPMIQAFSNEIEIYFIKVFVVASTYGYLFYHKDVHPKGQIKPN